METLYTLLLIAFKIFHLNFLLKNSKSNLHLPENRINEIENRLEEIIQNEIQSNKKRNMREKITESKVRNITNWSSRRSKGE